jgi:hypothetical protein
VERAATQRGSNADQILAGYPGPRRGYRLGDDEDDALTVQLIASGVAVHSFNPPARYTPASVGAA